MTTSGSPPSRTPSSTGSSTTPAASILMESPYAKPKPGPKRAKQHDPNKPHAPPGGSTGTSHARRRGARVEGTARRAQGPSC
jgi:hypothetical protein